MVILFFSLYFNFPYEYYKVIVPIETLLDTTHYDPHHLENKQDPLTLHDIPQKIVIISLNFNHFSKNANFIFHLPMVCLAWRRIHFKPIVLLVTSELSRMDKLVNKSIEYLRLLNIKTVNVKSPKNYETMIGMLSRLFSGLLPDDLVSPNDFVITTDSDLYPINKDFYNILNTNAITIWSAGCCGGFKHENKSYEMIAMGHVGMKKWQWLEVMKINNKQYKLDGESILRKVKESFDKSIFIKDNNEMIMGDLAYGLGE